MLHHLRVVCPVPVEDAPPLRHPHDPPGRWWVYIPALTREIDLEFRFPIGAVDPPVAHEEVGQFVFVGEGVHEGVDRGPGAEGGPLVAGHVGEQAFEEALCGGDITVGVAIGGPADLADDDLEVGRLELDEGPDEGVVHELDDVRVGGPVEVLDDVGGLPHEGEERVQLVFLQAEGGDQVHHEGGVVLLEEAEQLGHLRLDLVAELGFGGLGDVGLELSATVREGGLDLAAPVGIVQCLLHIVQNVHVSPEGNFVF